jgi:hypothetical protein
LVGLNWAQAGAAARAAAQAAKMMDVRNFMITSPRKLNGGLRR